MPPSWQDDLNAEMERLKGWKPSSALAPLPPPRPAPESEPTPDTPPAWAPAAWRTGGAVGGAIGGAALGSVVPVIGTAIGGVGGGLLGGLLGEYGGQKSEMDLGTRKEINPLTIAGEGVVNAGLSHPALLPARVEQQRA